MRRPDVGDLVCCLSDKRPGIHIRRIVTRGLELEQHDLIGPAALCGAIVFVDTLEVVDDADCPVCAHALTRVPR